MNRGIKNSENDDVGVMLRELKRVEAPANFDFGLKAKLAHGKRLSAANAGISRFVRYAAPAALVLVVGTVLVLNSLYLAGERSVAGVPEVTETKTAAPQTITENPAKSEPSVSEPTVTAAVNMPVSGGQPSGKAVPKSSLPVLRKTSRGTSGGSYDAAQRLQEPIYPKPSNANRSAEVNELSIKDIFGSLGIDASFNGTNWKVNSVSKKSIAEQVGIKVGDEPSAIDGQALSGTTVFKKPFTASTVTLIRDGKILRIKLR